MDQLLKARRLGSANARRQKVQEREQAALQAEQRRRRKLLYGYSSSEDDSSDDETRTFSPIIDDHGNDSAASASDDESTILSGTLKAPFSTDAFIFSVEESKANDHAQDRPKRNEKHDTNHLMPSAPPSPAFIRDPTIVDDDASTIDFYSDMSGAEDDFNPPPSPGIPFTAKSVMYLMPMAKPSIVSIRQSLPPLQTFGLDKPHRRSSPKILEPPPRSAKRMSSSMSLPSLSSYTSSSPNTPSSLPSSSTDLESLKEDETEERNTHKVKSSATNAEEEMPGRPLLKSTRTPSFARPQTSHGDETHGQSDNSHLELMPHGRSSIDSSRSSKLDSRMVDDSIAPRMPKRSSTSTTLSSYVPEKAVPYLPANRLLEQLPRSTKISAPTTPPPPPPEPESAPAKTLTRKKSFSGLRSRSESIGKAFRSASSSVKSRGRFPVVPSTNDSPPVPAIRPELKRMGSDLSLLDGKQSTSSMSRANSPPLTEATKPSGLGFRAKGSRMTMSLR